MQKNNLNTILDTILKELGYYRKGRIDPVIQRIRDTINSSDIYDPQHSFFLSINNLAFNYHKLQTSDQISLARFYLAIGLLVRNIHNSIYKLDFTQPSTIDDFLVDYVPFSIEGYDHVERSLRGIRSIVFGSCSLARIRDLKARYRPVLDVSTDGDKQTVLSVFKLCIDSISDDSTADSLSYFANPIQSVAGSTSTDTPTTGESIEMREAAAALGADHSRMLQILSEYRSNINNVTPSLESIPVTSSRNLYDVFNETTNNVDNEQDDSTPPPAPTW